MLEVVERGGHGGVFLGLAVLTVEAEAAIATIDARGKAHAVLLEAAALLAALSARLPIQAARPRS